MTDSKRSANSSLRSKLRGIKPAVMKVKSDTKGRTPAASSMAAANHIQHRLPFFLFDDLESALQCRQNLLRIIDHLAVAGEPLHISSFGNR